MSAKKRVSAAHREGERAAVRRARSYLKDRDYRAAIGALISAIEQSTAADVKDAWWQPKEKP